MKRIIQIFFVLLLPFISMATDSELIKVRTLYYKAASNKKDAEAFSAAMKSAPLISKSLAAGYTGMSYMINANFSYNPYNKLSYFIKGKDLLDGAISTDASNIELRFLRFCVQTNAPGFLGYSGKISEDKKLILLGFKHLTDEDLRKRIKDYMLASKKCTVEEKLLLSEK